jgi:hypothetical protein
MKEVKNIQEAISLIEFNNYYYKDGKFENRNEIEESAKNHFSSITENFDNKAEYYETFGLQIGECHTMLVKSEKIYISDQNITIAVHYFESYIDSGVPCEDYFYGYYIEEF